LTAFKKARFAISLKCYRLTSLVRYLVLLAGMYFCFTANAFAQYRYLLHKTYAQRVFLLNKFYVEDLAVEDSATLFSRINNIRKLAIDNNDDDLLLETRLLRAHYFYYRKFPASVVLPMLDSLRLEGKEKGKLWLQAMAENTMALCNFFYHQNYELGFEHHRRVYDLIKNISPADFPHKQHCLAQMAGEYYFFNDFRETIFYDLQALQVSPAHLIDRDPSELGILNTLGLCYQNLNMTDSAQYYFLRAIALAKTAQSEIWDGIASGNLGYNLFIRKNYQAAAPLLKKDVSIAVKNGDWALASGSEIVLANISVLKKDIPAASAQVTLSRQYVSKSGQYQRFAKLYPLLAKWYALTNQPALSAIYLDSTVFVKDSLSRKFNALVAARAGQKVDLEREKAARENIVAQKTINILQRNVLAGVVILMMVAAVMVYRSQLKKIQRQKEQVMRAREELDDAARQLNDFTRNISEKNMLIELLEQQSSSETETLGRMQQSTILTDADWAYFKGLFERVHGGYLLRLKEKLPGLTPAETRFMALSKLGLSTREMAAMLGIGTDAIRQLRTRLRKKLNTGIDENFEEVAAGI
jgi:DNA-binding CsgD family transcriptional regulator